MNSNERGDSVQDTHMHGGVGVFCMLPVGQICGCGLSLCCK